MKVGTFLKREEEETKVGMVILKLERQKLRQTSKLQRQTLISNILATIYVSRYTEQLLLIAHSLSLSTPTRPYKLLDKYF